MGMDGGGLSFSETEKAMTESQVMVYSRKQGRGPCIKYSGASIERNLHFKCKASKRQHA